MLLALDQVAPLLGRIRARRPLIHYMPNWVTANDVANVLLALGASPIMAVARAEVAEIHSAALALNIGTPVPERLAAWLRAGQAAAARGAPIILDPVGAGASTFRLTAARQLLAELPIAILRLNAGEATALLGRGEAALGVDSVDAGLDHAELASVVAQRYGCVVALTGARDAISDGTRTVCIDNGHPLLTRITGAGCMASAVVAACAAVEDQALLAATAGLLIFGVAAELAARAAAGPGSLHVALLDVLYALGEQPLYEQGKIV